MVPLVHGHQSLYAAPMSSYRAPIEPLVVIGAGAAGLLAGIFAGRAGVHALVLDTRRHPGAKIRASGGGRCNVMPVAATPDDFETQGSRNTLRNVLTSWPLPAMRAFFEQELNLPLRAEATGKLFPVSDNARDVVAVLLKELDRVGATLRTGAKVVAIEPGEGHYVLRMAEGEVIRARRVVLATGGLSMPTTGSDGTGLTIARSLQHHMIPTAPALVPLTGQHPQLGGLSGLSVDTTLAAVVGGRPVGRESGNLLFTHKGYSGPAVLNISRHLIDASLLPCGELRAGFGEPARLPAHHPEAWAHRLGRSGKRAVGTVVREALPRRLADALMAAAGLSEADAAARACELPRKQREALVAALTELRLPVGGSEGYRTAEVTRGGVCLNEVVGRTLESRRQPGLYLAGEILDVTGRLGGYNFLWAWASGRRAGMAAAAAAHKEAEGLAVGCVQEVA